MINSITIKNFKCYKSVDNIRISPITILYGENSAGKSSFLQAILLQSDVMKSRFSDTEPVEFSHGEAASHAGALFYAGKINNNIVIESSANKSGGLPLTVNTAFNYYEPINTRHKLINHMDMASLSFCPWFSIFPTETNTNLSFTFCNHPDVKLIYNELYARKEDVIEGYKRYAEMLKLNHCITNENNSANAIFADLQKYNPLEYDDNPFEWQSDSARVPLELRHVDGLPGWFFYALPGWADRRNAFKLPCDNDYLRKSIDFYSRDFTFEDFMSRISKSAFSLSRRCTISHITNLLEYGMDIDSDKLPFLVNDLIAASDPHINIRWVSENYPEDDGASNSGEFYLEGSSDLWIDKDLAVKIGLSKNGQGRRLSGRHLLSRLMKPELRKYEQHLKVENIVWIGPTRAAPVSSIKIGEDTKKTDKSEVDKFSLLTLASSRTKINYWLERLRVGYRVEIDLAGGDGKAQIMLMDAVLGGNVLVNWSEAGYGLSQIMPIIGSAICQKNSVILIQQPELHIHPRLQADLGDLFVEGFKSNQNQFIIETHSEHLMLRIQKLIRKGEISADDVSVLYVNRGENGSNINQIRLDKDGRFFDLWPGGGFFPERFNEMMPD